MAKIKRVRILFSLGKAAAFSHPKRNPGVGGTELMAVTLAATLAEEFPDLEVILSPVSRFSMTISEGPANLILKPLTSINEFNDDDTSCIVTYNLFKHNVESLDRPNVSIWSHNLWDSLDANLSKCKRVKAFIVVSQIQLAIARLANLGMPLLHIQNPIDMSQIPFFANTTSDVLEIGVLGTKGLATIADIWLDSCANRNVQAKLHVIGGPNLYAASQTSEEVAFRAIQESLAAGPGDVQFHGVLGEEKWDVLKRCSFGIVNPPGRTECFPTSIVEVKGTGAPVLSLPRWGNGELLCESDPFYSATRTVLKRTLNEILSGSTPLQADVRYNVRRDITRRIQPPSLVARKWMTLFHGDEGRQPNWSWAFRTLIEREPAALAKILLLLTKHRTQFGQ